MALKDIPFQSTFFFSPEYDLIFPRKGLGVGKGLKMQLTLFKRPNIGDYSGFWRILRVQNDLGFGNNNPEPSLTAHDYFTGIKGILKAFKYELTISYIEVFFQW